MKFFLYLGDPVVHRYLLLMMRVHSRHAAAPSGCRGNACYSYILFHLLMLGLHVIENTYPHHMMQLNVFFFFKGLINKLTGHFSNHGYEGIRYRYTTAVKLLSAFYEIRDLPLMIYLLKRGGKHTQR